jgi:glycosyltransferase involved in cell wall biosynthesis
MRDALTVGLPAASGVVEPDHNRDLWKAFHNRIVHDFIHRDKVNDVDEASLVVSSLSVIIPFHNRGPVFQFTVNALLGQDYRGSYDVIIVDDGSDDEVSLNELQKGVDLLKSFGKSVQVVTQENSYPGAARNNGVRKSKSDFVLFLDDDDIPKKTWMSTLVKVLLRTRADVVTSMVDFFFSEGAAPSKTESRWLVLGDSLEAGVFDNVFGAYSCLVRKDAFWEIGGFSEDFGSTFEDYEFLANVVLTGHRLQLVPDALLWYRQNLGHKHLMRETSLYENRMRALRAFAAHIPPELRHAFVFGYSNLKAPRSSIPQVRRMLEASIDNDVPDFAEDLFTSRSADPHTRPSRT